MSEPQVGKVPPNEEPTQRNIVKVVAASMIGTSVEWYDFFLFGSAAALVFGDVFFDEVGGTDGTLYSFMIYAVGFAARPIGGIAFGHFGDRLGRKKMLILSLLLMGGSTFAIGCLPTYAQVGLAAPLLLVLCRLIQGFAVGGEWGGAVLMAAEHGDNEKRGFWTSFVQAGVPAGNLLAAAVLWILQITLDDAAFESWGWRVAFLLSAVLVLVGLFVRLSVEESPVFSAAQKEMAQRKAATSMPLLEVIKHYPREILLAMGMRMSENISYYIFTVISISYLTDFLDVDGAIGTRAVLIGSAVTLIYIPLIGLLSDRVGRRPFYLAGAVGVGLFSFVFFDMLDSQSAVVVVLAVVVGLLLHGLMYSPQAAFFSELFGTSVRYSGASVGYQLASVVAGGIAPIVAIALLGDIDSPNHTAVGIYMLAASAISIVCVLLARETRGHSLEHDRAIAKSPTTTR